MTIKITTDELNRCKRAVVVLADISKTTMKSLGKEPPLEMKQDLLILTQVIRRLEHVATVAAE